MSEALKILKQNWGYDAFRPLQEDIINSVLDNKDTLALLPTGGGKSLCYQVPALIKEGVCLVVSPLIALMQDQVHRLRQLDISATCIHSGMHYSDVRRLLDNTMHGAYKLLYISPERLQTALFQEYMTEFDVSMIAVDEAHCISQWGHDFRPNYLKIANVREVYPSAAFLALTATATTDVQQDITKQLQLKDANVFKQSFARNNIFYSINYSENKNGDTTDNINQHCSIVYSRSRKQTEAIGITLEQSGISATVYHAGMKKEERERAQEQWMEGKSSVMVATTAFGMGIDKPDVRMVLHYDAPEHLEAYYQEAGRAGRDGKSSYSITLYNSSDIKRLHDSTVLQYPPEAYLRLIYQGVAEYLQIPIGTEPDKYYPFDLFDFSRKFSFQPAHAMNALKLLEQEGLWTLSESVYSPATVQFTADRHILDDLGEMYPDLAYVSIGLLRMYNTIFHYPTSVRETAIAKQLKMEKEHVIRALEQLHQMDILEYNKPGEGPQMFFHHYRVDSRHLIIDLNRIHILRKRHEARTEAMISFLENRNECRERILLSYFGEQVSADCGHCDNCRRKNHKGTTDIKELQKELLQVIQQKGSFDIKALIASYPPAIKEDLITLLRSMIDNGTLLLTDGYVSLSK
ncbi:MAG: ATP-dependent helicase, RecQ family [Flavipsychrobacter sp.]|nr:ATP-dependent helicase, RecQ family [Flavipsychrobacter sp.]